jgi:hypothetical protein
MTRYFIICSVTIISTGLCLSGCASRDSLNRQRQSFLLEIPANTERQVTPVPGVLKVRHCRAVAPFDSQYFLYRTEAGQYQQDYYRQFLTPPNEQITEYLRSWIEESGLFKAVLPASSAASPDYILEPHLLTLYSDFSDPTQPKTVLKMHVIVLKMEKSGQDRGIVIEKTYENIEPMQNKTSLNIIKNYNLGLEKIFVQLQSDIVSILQ